MEIIIVIIISHMTNNYYYYYFHYLAESVPMYFLSLGWAQLQQDITAKNEHIRTVEAENAKLYQQLMDKELVKLK